MTMMALREDRVVVPPSEETTEPVSTARSLGRSRTFTPWQAPAYEARPSSWLATSGLTTTALPRNQEARREALLGCLRQLFETISDENSFDDDCLVPTGRAVTATIDLLYRASRTMYSPLPAGVLYPDGDGGLRVDWESGDRQVRLVVHPSDPAQDYVYHQEGRDYSLDAGVTPEMLRQQLAWLNRAE